LQIEKVISGLSEMRGSTHTHDVVASVPTSVSRVPAVEESYSTRRLPVESGERACDFVGLST
jgi:hypothetical protein